MRWAWAEVDLGAIAHNVGSIAATVAPAEVWAVVKADAYGHGAVEVARTALAAGATGLCVALVQEGVALRAAGIEAPILVLSEQPPEELQALVQADLMATVYTEGGIDDLAEAIGAVDRASPVGVHLKFDTGMHRVGASPAAASALLAMVGSDSRLELAGLYTHLACADDPTAAVNELQLRRFHDAVASCAAGAAGAAPKLHAANSAAALAIPPARLDAVRLGIAMYGIEPGPELSDMCSELRPALSLHARVSMVKRVSAGEGISYGHRHHFEHDTIVATVPIGYADGVSRRLSGAGGEVLIHGRRLPIVGAVTMDALMVDCGGCEVSVGDECVLIGAQLGRDGSDAIPAEEWAARLGTIGYEVVCGISERIERRYIPA